MAAILAENLSGKEVTGTDGAKLGSLYNITMDLSSGSLRNLVVEPSEGLGEMGFEYDESGRLLVPVGNVTAVKDHVIVDR